MKPGQTLQLGQVELKLEAEGAAAAPSAVPPAAPVPVKKPVDATMVMPRGVSLGELEKVGRPPGFDSTTAFSKKRNRVNLYFIIGGIVVFIIIAVLLYIASRTPNPK